MPYAVNRAQRIAYEVEGSGPLVVLQHGMFSNRRGWKERGFVDALADAFRVARVDSLGHGESDKPADAALYAQDQRAGDLVAVMDALGAERAHVVGYSMGGWIAVGVAKYFPKRLASLTVAGWDLVDGMETARPPSSPAPITFEGLFGGIRRAAPPLVEWVTPETEPAIRACYDHVHDLAGASEAVLRAGCPVLLWNGQSDPYHDPMQAWAAAHGVQYLSTPGDHLTAMMMGVTGGAARGLRAFIEGAEQASARA
jgi:pimeloyl-ACP methyl ester carboxylesterase